MGRSHREAVGQLGAGLGTVSGVERRARAAGLDWLQVEALSDEVLEARLYGAPTPPAHHRPTPDRAVLHTERRKPGVRVIAVADGIDTGDDTAKVSVTVKSLENELYLDDLRKTTERGLDGRFLKGYATGGRIYGYRSEPVSEPGRTDSHGQPIPIGYRITLGPAEAAVVGRIFTLFREGLGEKAIAKQLDLNHAGRPWRPNTIYLMLQNSKYVGQYHFNRREWRKNPETGRRVYRWRPRDQWESRVIEDLRIIDNETWEAVQRRLKSRQHLFSRRRSATAHLLSGLL
ncbi:MAG: recombinase family protein, partial [Acidimicrobiia bacterium]